MFARGPVALVLLLAAAATRGKVFERCELARELKRLGADPDQISTWVCIAQRESALNSSAVGNLNADGSGDHGLFQISDRYWCSPQGWACNLPCSLLEDDDISDDWKCAKRIYRQHKLLSGNGFNAWAVYGPQCAGDTSAYLDGCSNSTVSTTESLPSSSTDAPPTPESSPPAPDRDVGIVESYSAREGNNAEKIQVLDLEMMEKKKIKSMPRRLWKPWTWEI